MPYDTGTGSIVNMLANPPNPWEELGKTVQGVTALRDFQAKRAIGDIYQQSIDPETGQLDLGKFNAGIQRNPAAAWAAGPNMQQSGQAQSAQGFGTQQDLEAKRKQLEAVGNIMSPLVAKIQTGQTVTKEEAQAYYERAVGLGLVTPQQARNYQKQLDQMAEGGNANGLIMGTVFAAESGANMISRTSPGVQPFQAGGKTYTMPTGTFVPPGTPTMGQGPGEISAQPGIGLVDVRMSDGTVRQMSEKDALARVGTEIEPGVKILPPPSGGWPAAGTVSGAAPAAPAAPGRPAAAASGRPATVPSARPGEPPRTTEQKQSPGTPQVDPATGATFGQSQQPGEQAVAEESANAYSAALNSQQASADRIVTIQNAKQALAGAFTGPGTDRVQAINGILGTFAPDAVQKIIPGYDPKTKAANYDQAQKYLQQIANAGAGMIGGQATNDKLAAASVANPSVHIQDVAADHVLNVLAAQERMKQYILKQAQAQNVRPRDYSKFVAKWAQDHDPRAFLPFDEKMQDYTLKHISGSEKKKLLDTLKELRDSGDLPPYETGSK